MTYPVYPSDWNAEGLGTTVRARVLWARECGIPDAQIVSLLQRIDREINETFEAEVKAARLAARG